MPIVNKITGLSPDALSGDHDQIIETEISIALMRTDGGTQVRRRTDRKRAQEYSTLMQEGTIFPPVDLVFDGNVYWLWDGNTRHLAAELANRETLPARVRSGTLQDAVWLSKSANKDAAKPLTNEEKRQAVMGALRHPRAKDMSDREIAKHCGVSHTTVQNIRAELAAGTDPDKTARRVNAARIGSGSPLQQLQQWWAQAPTDERIALRAWVMAQGE